MKTHTRTVAAVAGIAILVGAASSGTIASQGQTEQHLTHDAVILVSAVSAHQHGRADRTSGHHHAHRADSSERHGSPHSGAGKTSSVQDGTAAAAGVEAAAAVNAGADVEVVLKSLPGVDSKGVDSKGVDSAGADSAGESCS